jgi:hypothetical protein
MYIPVDPEEIVDVYYILIDLVTESAFEFYFCLLILTVFCIHIPLDHFYNKYIWWFKSSMAKLHDTVKEIILNKKCKQIVVWFISDVVSNF